MTEFSPLSTAGNRTSGRTIRITIDDPTKHYSIDVSKITEDEFYTKLTFMKETLNKKEFYYITAIRNLIKKTNYLELYQELLQDQISEEDFHEKINSQIDKYENKIDEASDLRDINMIFDIVRRVGVDLKEFSLNDIDEIFSIDASKHVNNIFTQLESK